MLCSRAAAYVCRDQVFVTFVASPKAQRPRRSRMNYPLGGMRCVSGLAADVTINESKERTK
jgi:hypothetical protein